MRPLALCLVTGVVTACSSEPTPAWSVPSTMEESPLSVCPQLLEDANLRACSGAQLRCTFPIQCPTLPQQAICTCEGGKFRCSDAYGPLAGGETATCSPRAQNDDSPCPPTQALARGAVCPTIGKTCFYEGPICPESLTKKPALDYCQCKPDGEGGSVFVCYPKQCRMF